MPVTPTKSLQHLFEQIRLAQDQKHIIAFYHLPESLHDPTSNQHQAIFYLNNHISKDTAYQLYHHIRNTYPVLDVTITQPTPVSDMHCITFVYFDPI